MAKSEERFARQHLCALPSEFPLTSRCSAIAHCLSGPGLHAITHNYLRRSSAVDAAVVIEATSHPFSFNTRGGFFTDALARKLDSLARVSRRVG